LAGEEGGWGDGNLHHREGEEKFFCKYSPNLARREVNKGLRIQVGEGFSPCLPYRKGGESKEEKELLHFTYNSPGEGKRRKKEEKEFRTVGGPPEKRKGQRKGRLLFHIREKKRERCYPFNREGRGES